MSECAFRCVCVWLLYCTYSIFCLCLCLNNVCVHAAEHSQELFLSVQLSVCVCTFSGPAFQGHQISLFILLHLTWVLLLIAFIPPTSQHGHGHAINFIFGTQHPNGSHSFATVFQSHTLTHKHKHIQQPCLHHTVCLMSVYVGRSQLPEWKQCLPLHTSFRSQMLLRHCGI